MVTKKTISRRTYIVGLFLCLVFMGGAILLAPLIPKIVPKLRNISAGNILSSIKKSPLAKYAGFSEERAGSRQMSQDMSSMSGMAEMSGMEVMPSMGTGAKEKPTHIPLRLNLARQQLMGVQTTEVGYKSLKKVIRTVGRVTYDERRLSAVSLKIGGWIGDLFVDYAGKFVEKGEPLFTIYSPDLVSTQEEYLLALRTRQRLKESSLPDARQGADSLVNSAKNRLLLWDITEAQIRELEKTGKAKTYQTIYSPVSGYVIKNNVAEGMYVNFGMTLHQVADLSRVWIQGDIYEYEMPFVRVGQTTTVTLPYDNEKTYKGKITYVYPYLEGQTRTVRVRMEFPNPDLKLKPEMYTDVEIKVEMGKKLAVPDSAVIRTGLRELVFVARGNGLFEPVEVKLGAKIDNFYEVLSGVSEGEKVVTSGSFLLDSESRLMAATGGMKGMMSMIGMGDAPMEGATMGGMEGMEGMSGMGDMQGMEGMGGMKGMEGMMEGMEPVEPTSKMKGMSGMEGMEGMEEAK